MLLSGYSGFGLSVTGAAVTGAAGSSLDEPDVAHTETHIPLLRCNDYRQYYLPRLDTAGSAASFACFRGIYCYSIPCLKVPQAI
jgi:hypothetical protein